MKIHLYSQLTRPSALWLLSEAEFREFIVIPAVQIARECHLRVLDFELDGESLRILLGGPESMIRFFRRCFKAHTEMALRIVKSEYSNRAFTDVFCISAVDADEYLENSLGDAAVKQLILSFCYKAPSQFSLQPP